MKKLARHIVAGDIVDFPRLDKGTKVFDVARECNLVKLNFEDGTHFTFLEHVPVTVLSHRQNVSALYAELLRQNTQVGTIVGGRYVFCLCCKAPHPFMGTPLLRGNIGQYRQTCHHCNRAIVEGSEGWVELFPKPQPMIRLPDAPEHVRRFAAGLVGRLENIRYADIVEHAMFDTDTDEIVVNINDREKRFRVSGSCLSKENPQ